MSAMNAMSAMSGGPLPRTLSPLALPLSWGYGFGVRAVSAVRGLGIGVRRLSVPVLSVGNVTVGGTGKSPFVAWAARTLAAAGARPAIALRGYGSVDPARGDEVLEYRETAPGIPVLAGPDRHAMVQAALARGEPIGCVVLDDGFQHRRLARDLDVVLIDATRPGLDGPLLPAGWLREPAGALRRADLVVVTRATRIDQSLADAIRRFHGREPFAWCDHRWAWIEVVSASGTRIEPVSWLDGRSVAIVAGIGHPEAFVDAARRAGAAVADRTIARDHARWDGAAGDAALATGRGTGLVLTTRKDWVKLVARPLPAGVEVAIPRLELAFLAGESALRERLVGAAAPARR
jgi:tetraacyldisaccharide 4'-kinase